MLGSSGAEETARRVFAAIAERDLEAVAACLAPDDIQVFVPVGRFEGRDAVVAFFADLFAAFPDLEMTVQAVRADDRCAAVRWRLAGTFTGGPFLGIHPTGKRVQIEGVDAFIEVEGGLIRSNTIFYDGAAFLRGVGLLPPRDSTMERGLIRVFNLWTSVRRMLPVPGRS